MISGLAALLSTAWLPWGDTNTGPVGPVSSTKSSMLRAVSSGKPMRVGRGLAVGRPRRQDGPWLNTHQLVGHPTSPGEPRSERHPRRP